MDLSPLIQDSLKGKRKAQSELYRLLAPKMFAVCLRYTGTRHEAEDLLQEGFLKTFASLHSFRNEGSFEGWVRRIVVNCALARHRSRSPLLLLAVPETHPAHPSTDASIISGLAAKELLELVAALPPAYRLVFNLYVFEGFRHKEIARMLGITEGTSKSNLSDARTLLRERLRATERAQAPTRSIG